jgi:hypothetical protein
VLLLFFYSKIIICKIASKIINVHKNDIIEINKQPINNDNPDIKHPKYNMCLPEHNIFCVSKGLIIPKKVIVI